MTVNDQPTAITSEKPDPSVDSARKGASKKSRTFGEKVLDWGIYGGVGGIVTFILSLASTHWARYGTKSNTLNDMMHSLEKTGIGKESAESIVLTTALSMGGNAALVPIKFLEDRRSEIVGAINASTGCSPAEPPHHDKQTWSSLIKGRLVAWVAVFASFKTAFAIAGKDRFEKFEKNFAKDLVCAPLNRPTHHLNGQETKLFQYGRIAALDLFATVAATSLLYVGSRFFASKKTDSVAPELEDKNPQEKRVISVESDTVPEASTAPTCKRPFRDCTFKKSSFTAMAQDRKNSLPNEQSL